MAIFLMTLAPAVCAQPAPELARLPRGLVMRRIPPLILDDVVARHLDTGLTTSFVFSVDAGRVEGRALKGEAQVRIRYDLWDERYVLERWDGERSAGAATWLARSELPGWWRALALLLFPAEIALPARPQKAKVTAVVLPFSQTEQRDAQDWLLRSFRPAEAPTGTDQRDANAKDRQRREGVGSRGAAAGAPLRDFYGSLLASSIGLRSLITYSWTVPLPAGTP